MPAATNIDDLCAITAKEFTKLFKLLEGVYAALADVPHHDTTIRSVIGHRAHWTELFLGWYGDGQAQKAVYFPAEGYKWNELKRYNADLREAEAGLSWDDVKKMLHDSYVKLTCFIDADLYGGPMKGDHNNLTPGRWAEATGASHYRSAAKYVRAVRRTTA